MQEHPDDLGRPVALTDTNEPVDTLRGVAYLMGFTRRVLRTAVSMKTDVRAPVPQWRRA